MVLHQILPHLIYEFKSEADLLVAIDELSHNFTRDRSSITEYLSDERLTAAYTCFYLTTNMPKFKGVLKWLPQSFTELLKETTLFDMGSGPGTFSLAFREWMERPASIVQFESSLKMREQAMRLWQGLYPDEPIRQISHLNDSKQQKITLLYGHSANEMGPEVVLRHVELLSPDLILFIEPGTKAFFENMLMIRKQLLKFGYNVVFPCPQNEACPLEGSTTDWCHQFLHVKQSAEIERLSQMARKDRRMLPLTVQAFSKLNDSQETKVRVIRVFTETKFSFEWDVCELNQHKHFQIMKRGLSKETLEKIGQVMAGDAVEIEVDKNLEQAVRVRVKSINNRSL